MFFTQNRPIAIHKAERKRFIKPCAQLLLLSMVVIYGTTIPLLTGYRATSAAQATAGAAVIIDGTNANGLGSASGGQNNGGWLYMQKALESLAAQVSAGTSKTVVSLGTAAGSVARRAIDSAFNLSTLPGAGWKITHIDTSGNINTWLSNLSTGNTGILYIPTYNLTDGDLQESEITVINNQTGRIASYLNSTSNRGALFAMGESNSGNNTGSWNWLRTLFPGITVTTVSSSGVQSDITLTNAGTTAFPGLSNSHLAGADPWHNYFTGSLGTLNVLGTAPQNNVTRQIILGGVGIRVPQADMAITKTASADDDDTLTWTITVKNNGPDTATEVIVRDTLPAGATFVSCNATGNGVCGGSGANRTITFSSLDDGASATATIAATVARCGSFANTGTVESKVFDSNTNNNSVTVTSDVVFQATITPENQNFPITGGSGTVNVAVASNCTWTAATNDAWIKITSGSTGSGNGTVNFTVEANTSANARAGSITIAGRTFIVRQEGLPRVVRLACADSTPNGTLTLPIELLSLGDENALGFSINFDPAILRNPQVTKGADATAAALNLNSSQIAQGRLGIALALPTGQSFATGIRRIAVISFSVPLTTSGTSTEVEFGDAPIRKQVANASAQPLNGEFRGCENINIVPIGYEADVTPRPNGKQDGTIAITDWVQVGRFVTGLDSTSSNSEFQRADCAPRATKGDGEISLVDWVQAGRYAAGLDAPQNAGGPISSSSLASAAAAKLEPETPLARVVRVANAVFQRGQENAINIEFEAEGDENALGFSLSFDPNVVRFVSASAGGGIGDATLIANTNQSVAGRMGLAIALPAGQKLKAGKQTIVTVRFASLAGSNAVTTTIGFDDQPVHRQIAGVDADLLPAGFTDGSITIRNNVVSVSAASYQTELAAESIAAAFGISLATTTLTATSLPLPTSLAGTTVKIKDIVGVERLAPLFFVKPDQVNYLTPEGTAAGAATVTITSGSGSVALGTATIVTVAPSLFTANADGQGVPAALVLRIRADGSQSYEPAARYDTAQSKFIPQPIDLGSATDQVFLILYGGGIRHRSNLAMATALIGGINADVLYAGPQGDLVGVDQVNLRLPRNLAGRGEVDVILSVENKFANMVRISVK